MTKFTLERVAQPDFEPVTLAEAKRHLREFDSVTAADADITALIVSAREWVEDYTGRALVDQTWRLTLHGRLGSFAGGDIVGGTRDGMLPAGYGYYSGLWNWGRYGEIMLRKAPVLAISSFVSVDQTGAETAVASNTYQLREAAGKWPRIVALNGATWATWLTGDLRITFRAGFIDTTGSPSTGTVPTRFQQAIKLHVEAHYDRDKDMMQKLLDAAEALIRPERSNLQIA